MFNAPLLVTFPPRDAGASLKELQIVEFFGVARGISPA